VAEGKCGFAEIEDGGSSVFRFLAIEGFDQSWLSHGANNLQDSRDFLGKFVNRILFLKSRSFGSLLLLDPTAGNLVVERGIDIKSNKIQSRPVQRR
jgi:hypothetical protein